MASPPPKPPFPLPELLRRIERAIAEGEKRHAGWKEAWERQQAQEREMWARQHAQGWEQWAQHYAQEMEQWAEKHAQRVERGAERWAQGVERGAERWAQGVERWADRLGRKQRRKWERRMARERLREERRALKRQKMLADHHANPFMGWVFALAALVTAGMAVTKPGMWWLVFVAFGLGSSAAGIFGHVRSLERARLQEGGGQGTPAREDTRDEAPVQPEAPRKTEAPRESEDPRTARVDALCDKLLAELRSGPGVLRDVVHQPEQTVEGLRKSCHELARRERELRALSTPEDERRLEEEYRKLTARVASESDAVVKERLEKTLHLLDEQRRQRAELTTSASRLEAEHMRLYYTLENLYTQVLRVRSADAGSADVAGAGLRRSVEQLGLEMDAVAEALEEVHRDAPPRERVPTR